MPVETVTTLIAELHGLRTRVGLAMARRRELVERLARTDPTLRRERNGEKVRLANFEARLRALDPRPAGAARALGAAIRQSRRLAAHDRALALAVAKVPASARPTPASATSPSREPAKSPADPGEVLAARAMIPVRLFVAASLIEGLLPANLSAVVQKAVAVEIERLD